MALKDILGRIGLKATTPQTGRQDKKKPFAPLQAPVTQGTSDPMMEAVSKAIPQTLAMEKEAATIKAAKDAGMALVDYNASQRRKEWDDNFFTRPEEARAINVQNRLGGGGSGGGSAPDVIRDKFGATAYRDGRLVGSSYVAVDKPTSDPTAGAIPLGQKSQYPTTYKDGVPVFGNATPVGASAVTSASKPAATTTTTPKATTTAPEEPKLPPALEEANKLASEENYSAEDLQTAMDDLTARIQTVDVPAGVPGSDPEEAQKLIDRRNALQKRYGALQTTGVSPVGFGLKRKQEEAKKNKPSLKAKDRPSDSGNDIFTLG